MRNLGAIVTVLAVGIGSFAFAATGPGGGSTTQPTVSVPGNPNNTGMGSITNEMGTTIPSSSMATPQTTALPGPTLFGSSDVPQTTFPAIPVPSPRTIQY